MTLESLDDWIATVVRAAPSMPRGVAACLAELLWVGPEEAGVDLFLEMGDLFADTARELQIQGRHEQANELARLARLVRTQVETGQIGE